MAEKAYWPGAPIYRCFEKRSSHPLAGLADNTTYALHPYTVARSPRRYLRARHHSGLHRQDRHSGSRTARAANRCWVLSERARCCVCLWEVVRSHFSETESREKRA